MKIICTFVCLLFVSSSSVINCLPILEKRGWDPSGLELGGSLSWDLCSAVQNVPWEDGRGFALSCRAVTCPLPPKKRLLQQQLQHGCKQAGKRHDVKIQLLQAFLG